MSAPLKHQDRVIKLFQMKQAALASAAQAVFPLWSWDYTVCDCQGRHDAMLRSCHRPWGESLTHLARWIWYVLKGKRINCLHLVLVYPAELHYNTINLILRLHINRFLDSNQNSICNTGSCDQYVLIGMSGGCIFCFAMCQTFSMGDKSRLQSGQFSTSRTWFDVILMK